MNSPNCGILLRDIKYDIAAFDHKGSSYRAQGSDPRLLINTNRNQMEFRDFTSVHVAPFHQRNRTINRVDAYAGLEDVRSVALPQAVGACPPGLQLADPDPFRVGNTNVPLPIPIGRIGVSNASVTLKEVHGLVPQDTVSAMGAEILIDWEMSHERHRLQFNTPGLHVAIRAGNWTPSSTPLPFTGVRFTLSQDGLRYILYKLPLVLRFDAYIKVVVQETYTEGKPFMDVARDIYSRYNGQGIFGHGFDDEGFHKTMELIGGQVQAQASLRNYYGV